jgi:uncharacterized membrane protein
MSSVAAFAAFDYYATLAAVGGLMVFAALMMLAVTVAVATVASATLTRRTVLVEARAASIAVSAVTATRHCQRTAGAQGEESNCEDRRQARPHEESLLP